MEAKNVIQITCDPRNPVGELQQIIRMFLNLAPSHRREIIAETLRFLDAVLDEIQKQEVSNLGNGTNSNRSNNESLRAVSEPVERDSVQEGPVRPR